jgi:PhzF family phenazine biosynthesis protein
VTRRFQQVDVFTDEIGLGNPVAVVVDGEHLSDHEMSRFAAWTNLSETTFLLPPTDAGADYRVRIFTPTEELPFAGHPTIGSCHAWLHAGGAPRSDSAIVQQCGVGLVRIERLDGRLAFATPPLIRSGPVDAPDLAAATIALGIDAADIVASSWVDNGPRWVGVRVSSPELLRSLRPNLEGVGFNIGAVALTGTADPAIEVRAFFFAGSTREDPVTGSLNGSLAQWMLGSGLLTAPYVASQGTALGRNGRVHVSEARGEIWIGGDAVTVIEGHVDL